MPKATKKNMMLDRPAEGRGGWSGRDETLSGKNAQDEISQWLIDMGFMDREVDIPPSGLIGECIVTAGGLNNDVILAKNRDRMFQPTIQVVRKLSKSGIEMALMYDKRTKYVEGMNEYGIGIINSTLLNTEDSTIGHSYNNRQGNVIHRALCCKNLKDAINVVISHKGGSEGHTMIGSGKRLFHIEKSYHLGTKVTELDASSGFDVRTNHGFNFPKAGFVPKDGSNYLGSHIRKAYAEIELLRAKDDTDVLRLLRQQPFEPDSNYNMRRTLKTQRGMFTSNQLLMNLTQLEFRLNWFSDWCDFDGIMEEAWPEDREKKIKIYVKELKG
jgi:hypothetical protein